MQIAFIQEQLPNLKRRREIIIQQVTGKACSPRTPVALIETSFTRSQPLMMLFLFAVTVSASPRPNPLIGCGRCRRKRSPVIEGLAIKLLLTVIILTSEICTPKHIYVEPPAKRMCNFTGGDQKSRISDDVSFTPLFSLYKKECGSFQSHFGVEEASVHKSTPAPKMDSTVRPLQSPVSTKEQRKFPKSVLSNSTAIHNTDYDVKSVPIFMATFTQMNLYCYLSISQALESLTTSQVGKGVPRSTTVCDIVSYSVGKMLPTDRCRNRSLPPPVVEVPVKSHANITPHATDNNRERRIFQAETDAKYIRDCLDRDSCHSSSDCSTAIAKKMFQKCTHLVMFCPRFDDVLCDIKFKTILTEQFGKVEQ
ncbi:hypothetical protein GEV33_006938 [Tenebrio molitor]|uniref:Uncharacterized protein n=1 Tax=Tenebrio molitor TaxID=7067 RepID=A0A8J6HLQ2_TENMO|nr:hypothetical protein GEV33_006938 [Tenebrio molitor]